MRIRLGYEIAYECPGPTPLLLMLKVRPEREVDLVTPQVMTTDRGIPLHDYIDGFGNVVTRALAPAGVTTFKSDFVIEDTGQWDVLDRSLPQHPVEELPDDLLVFLLASRYCETDLLSDLAWAEFGSTPPTGERVAAIVKYAHERIEFGYKHASVARTAHSAHADQRGVCRDYAHLAVALCRCMNIPARYCTGYLGDIGVPISPDPMDFSAWFQVYLGGEWRTWDARHNKPRVGRVLQAWGRDAADVAITTSFGSARLAKFDIISDEVA